MTDRTETIATYLDGTLEGADLAAFEAELAQDGALAGEVARFAGNDDLLRAAFAAPMMEPVDAALLERMGLAGPAAPTFAEPPMAANDNPPFWRRWQWPAGAIAASLALIAVFQTGQGPGGQSEFAAALDQAPSASSVQLADGSSLTPRLTFAAADGRFCREYLLVGKAGGETGIACRSAADWRIEAAVKGGTMLPGSGVIVAAGGEGSSALDAAYARLGASDPLGSDAEKSLIESKWARR